jgi:hypothetical protein
VGVHNEMVTNHEETRGLATRLNNLEDIQHAGRDGRNWGRDHERERDHYRQGTQSPTRHEERLFKNIKLTASTFDGCLDP